MQSQKAQKIDLNQDYPCPSCPYRRQGRLVPITLTEAFGCNRCQQIFVIEEGGYAVEQLSTTYPYKRVWRWTGQQWTTASRARESYLPIAIWIIIILLVMLPLAMQLPSNPQNILLWAMMTVMVAMLPALLLWLAYRR